MRLALPAMMLLSLAVPAPAAAQGDVLTARLLPGWQTDRGTYMAALEFALAPGWKTYWRSPGEAGIPPTFDWSASDNLGAVALHWPRPVVFETLGMQSIGYHDLLVLPLEVTPAAPDRPVALRVTVDLGVCDDICIPAQVTVAADLTGPGAADGAIAAALADRPKVVEGGAVCDLAPAADGLTVTARVALPALAGPEVVVIDPQDPGLWVSDSRSMREGDRLVATADILSPGGAPPKIDRARLTIAVIGRDGAVEIAGCPAP